MAIFMNSRKFFLVASSELLSDSSVAIAPGEIIVQRIFWECSSIPSPSVNATATVDGPLDERFHFCALRHIGGKSDGLAAGGRDLLNHCVDPVRAPRS